MTASVLPGDRCSSPEPRNSLVLLAAGPSRIPAPKGLCLDDCQVAVRPTGGEFLPGLKHLGLLRYRTREVFL